MTDNILKPESFIPYIVSKNRESVYAVMLAELPLCGCCEVPILPKGPWPMWVNIDGKAQSKLAGWKQPSDVYFNSRPVCSDCVKENRITFQCRLCQQDRPSSQVQETIGYPSDYLCSVCYGSVSAKEWEAVLMKLEERHRYDFSP